MLGKTGGGGGGGEEFTSVVREYVSVFYYELDLQM